MAGDILGAGVFGVVVILVFGGLLALAAVFLPRLLKHGEAGFEARWGVEEMGPGGFNLAETVSSREVERPAPTLPPREAAAARPGTEADDPLLAAAIGLALTLYQQGQVRPAAGPAPARVESVWALSGRWQAMQARLYRQKR